MKSSRLIQALSLALATKKTSFMPEKLVMVDCEMTGVVAGRDDLLQAAFIKLRYDGEKYCKVGEPLVLYMSHSGRPNGEFQNKYLTDVFDKCNASNLKSDEFKSQLHSWLGDYKGEATPVGDCVPTDIAFLLAGGCIDPCDYDGEGKAVKGTFHYEFFDLNAVKAIARTKAGQKFEIDGINKEGIHDALVDCENQLLELNEFLRKLL